MLVLVTGGSGFIGSRLIGRLIAAGHRVRSAGRRPARIVAASAQAPDRDSRIEHVAADFTRDHSTEDWLPRLEGVDVVVNAVGIIRERGPQSFDALHTRAPSALFAACERAGVRRVVQLSALGADEQAASRFHLSKRRADEFLLGLRVSAAVVQPSLVYGPGGGSARLFDTLASLPLAPLPAGG
ncbi:MAG: SDR family NAD(P)-dependent oxidoreductase, partial [Limnobacter sp.]|nr:SDR family NAD(P)-dependent oxidoreductase [Limnobacter sp.]